jgi:hypothetical protein
VCTGLASATQHRLALLCGDAPHACQRAACGITTVARLTPADPQHSTAARTCCARCTACQRPQRAACQRPKRRAKCSAACQACDLRHGAVVLDLLRSVGLGVWWRRGHGVLCVVWRRCCCGCGVWVMCAHHCERVVVAACRPLAPAFGLRRNLGRTRVMSLCHTPAVVACKRVVLTNNPHPTATLA